MAERPTKVVYGADDAQWRIESVTVYDQSAEISRVLQFSPEQAGTYELVLEGLPPRIKPDSLRAEVRTANATILEVSFDQKSVAQKETEFDATIKELNTKIGILGQETSRWQKRKGWLQQYAQSVIPKAGVGEAVGDSKPVSAMLMSSDALSKVQNFMEFYDQQTEKAEAKLEEIKKETEATKSELVKVNKQRADAMTRLGAQTMLRTATTLVQVEAGESGKLSNVLAVRLFYLVTNAKWTASYDIRVLKSEKKLNLTYYGEVVNNTGESWSGVNLSLSTARPSIGGSLPILPSSYVQFSSGVTHLSKTNHKKKKKQARRNRNMVNFNDANLDLSDDEEEEWDLDELSESSDSDSDSDDGVGGVLTTEVKQTGGASLFNIQRIATIESDGKPHKQTIAAISGATTFTYVASPKISNLVYLKCSSKNTSTYPLLEGSMAVFIDGTFIATSSIGNVSIGQEFGAFLGVDQSIKVEYQPEKQLDDSKTKGIIIKSSTKSRTYNSRVKVINTGDEAATISVYLQIPLSNNNKIKVNILKPDITKSNKTLTYKQNRNGLLEARKLVEGRKDWYLDFEYQLLWPNGRDVEQTTQTTSQAEVKINKRHNKGRAKKQAMNEMAWNYYS